MSDQKILKTTEEFRPDAVGDAVHDLASVLRWIDMNPERALAKREVDHLPNCVGDCADISVPRLSATRPALMTCSMPP
jgi:hypothetical protein